MNARASLVKLVMRLWALVPSSGVLPADVWRGRLRFLIGLTWFHAAIIAASGPFLGYRWEIGFGALFDDGTVLHPVAEALVVASFAALASWRRSSRMVQATAVGFGLMGSSAILVHLSGGYIELHFHFFVMLVFLALLQEWSPYLLAVGFVAVHHGVVGVMWPEEVYNHPAAIEAPWTFAAIHAMFVLWACVGSVIAWRFNERAFAQTSLILEATGEGIFGLDAEGRITFVNPAAATMLRASASRLTDRPVAGLLRPLNAEGAEIPAGESPLLAPLHDGRPRSVTEGLFARMDGTTFPVDCISTPMIERGTLTGVVVSFRDVTERKRVQADLQNSHRRLEEALAELEATQRQVLRQERLRAMGQMASGIAHDFNNSLAPILGFSELLLRPGQPHDAALVQAYMRHINTAARDASGLVGRLRELYRERTEPVEISAVNLTECIDEAVALTQPRWKNQAMAKGATIHVDVDAQDVPHIAGDSSAMREVLTNLIFNAVDAMPSGGTISITGRPDGDFVRLAIRDTGVGMTDDVRQRCLEPFFSTKGPQGTGLGLPMVQALVERHRGTVDIESRPGQGTTFILRLPVYTERAGAETKDPAVGERSPTSSPRRIRRSASAHRPARRSGPRRRDGGERRRRTGEAARRLVRPRGDRPRDARDGRRPARRRDPRRRAGQADHHADRLR
ncbi:MAG: PAS domain-containing protein [Candidatus Rokubacteria bacterium]|nr:PAS domain-containing protein [Candidatus Rokubacteria bacterium]